MKNNKILILGAANDQVKLISTAKRLGYFVVVCDFTTTNPGLSFVDKHYQVDYTNKDEVLAIARKENVGGVISNSELAMPIVAHVATQLNLIGNTPESIETFANKSLFRDLQKKCNLYTPRHIEVKSEEEAVNIAQELNFPILMKACKCSATRGTYKINKFEEQLIRDAFNNSKQFAWNEKVAIEEFVEMPSLTTYEGDVFVHHGELMFDGLFYVQRSKDAPMIPMTYVGPVPQEDSNIKIIQEVLTKAFNVAGIIHGQYNVELYFTTSGEPFIIEINSRQGGRNLPEFIKQFCGIDFTEILISTCMGDDTLWNKTKRTDRIYSYRAHHMLMSSADGILENVVIDDELSEFVSEQKLFRDKGMQINRAVNGTDIIGFVDVGFNNRDQWERYAFNMEKYIQIKI